MIGEYGGATGGDGDWDIGKSLYVAVDGICGLLASSSTGSGCGSLDSSTGSVGGLLVSSSTGSVGGSLASNTASVGGLLTSQHLSQ